MGLLDIGREVLTEYKADISDHKAKVKELEGAEKELAEQELANAEARNEHLDSWIEHLGKVTLAIGAIAEIGEIAFDGYKEKIKEARLETAAHGVDLEKLRESAHGLKTEMELLEFAAKANNTAWKNSQTDMENAQAAIYALEARGVDAATATNAVTDAVVGLRTRGLQALGVEIDKHVPKMDEYGHKLDDLQQKEKLHEEILKAVKQLAAESGNAHEIAGEQMQRTGVDLANNWANLKKALGGLVESMQPMLASIAKAVGLIAQLGSVASKLTDHIPSWMKSGLIDNVDSLINGPDRADRNIFRDVAQGYSDKQRGAQFQPLVDYDMALLRNVTNVAHHFGDIEIDLPKWKAPKPEGDLKFDPDAWEDANAALTPDELAHTKYLSVDDMDRGQRKGQTKAREEIAAMNKEMTQLRESAREMEKMLKPDIAAQALGFKSHDEQTFLQKTFGKVSDFDIYKEAFKALEGGVSSALKAWIEGSMSAGEAFKKFIGQAMESLAIQMGVESIKHAAYALGSLAFGDAEGAAKHGLAAAEFAAGALLAALAAKELGVGAKSPATAKGAGAGGSANAYQRGQDQSGAHGPVIVIGDSFAQDSPRMRQQNAQNLVALGLAQMTAGLYG